MLASRQLAAQACPNPLLTPPPVGLSVRIEGCDFLAALAEPRHPRECAALLPAVMADSTSRVHELARSLADTLRGVFATHFGFLHWQSPSEGARWSVQVRLRQPGGPGTAPTLELGLFDGATLKVPSERQPPEPLPFEPYEAIDVLYDEQRGLAAGSLDRTRARLVKDVVALLEQHDGNNRRKLIKSVLRYVPLTSTPLTPTAEDRLVWTRVPVRDADIRAEPESRPTFEWQVEKVRRVVPGAPRDTAVNPGVFVLGECMAAGEGGYSCKMLGLSYGGSKYETDRVAEFFERAAPLTPPMALYVVDYRPAREACSLRGVIPHD